MDPAIYVPRYLERLYERDHPDLTDAACELLRERIARTPEAFALTEHARALLSYERAHTELMSELERLADLPDDEFERQRGALFEHARNEFERICRADEACVDARLVSILLSEVPLDACLAQMRALEQEVRAGLLASRPGFDPDARGMWSRDGDTDPDACERTLGDPDVIGWLHILEALAQGCIMTTRYRAAAEYARRVMRADGYPSLAIGTLLLALARLEDEEGFFEAVRLGGEGTEDLPWFLLGRTLLLYKLGRKRSAKRALKDFAARCDGGAFFLLNPTFHEPYLPVRPAPLESWDLSHQAVWEADGVIADTPDFTAWASEVEGVQEEARDFALRNGF